MSKRARLVEYLTSVPLFAACGTSDLKILARHLIEVEVPQGVEIVTEGEDADAFYVVLDGEGTVTRKVGRRTTRVGGVKPGSHFGELGLLDPAPRNATITAKTPMVVGVLGGRVFKAVLRDVPRFSEKLLAGLARRLRETDQQLVESDAAASASRPRARARAAADERPARRPSRTRRSG